MYSVPVDKVLERIRMLILNAILLNVLAGAALFTLARMYERRISFRRKATPCDWKNMSSSIARLSPPRQWVSAFCVPLMASIF
ncbi:hypothetical protein ACVXG8_22520 [Escherichia coli]